MESETSLVIGAVGLVFVLIILASAIRIVPEYQRLVVLRLGRALGARGPGLIILIPVVDRGIKVDLREIFFDVHPQAAITMDNAPISVDFYIYMKVVDPMASVLQVKDFFGASQGIAITTLRAVVGEMLLDDVLARREQINEVLRVKLDEVTNRWGIKVTAVEIREIVPPRDIQDAMSKQMSAERSRRAVVTEAEGKREAQIKIAEGERQATILRAEGEKQAAILEAEGERQARILVAEGYAEALQRIFAAAKGVDSKTMALQYLEALKDIGSGESTKFVIPLEFTRMIQPFVSHTEKSVQD
ncbi:MAG: SPFH/Band 7/PHB domain protein [Armatimonadetes bacterium]|nr:SPFH/Band 7/PHB domain protein [Armatimonadota bacterium]NIM24566.1 SPFH/Band 7/PHB domain protein [Armatimonadota bacterium]NIM68442.1 SPFH/Band 7/PHB domain protein [Armatimonadota bacterium]NIM76828.1 SPFH/Band 7/PHB domain protein [Armatimonadota bacterium]NIN06639.1 SPFH/Band 7/PHB domain protein [Armatimonadota bacterium]